MMDFRLRTRFSIDQVLFVAQIAVATGFLFVVLLLLGRGRIDEFEVRVSNGERF